MPMSKKRIINLITIASFLLLCCILPIFGAAAEVLGFSDTQAENRAYEEFPKVRSMDELLSFPGRFESWFSDHMFFKTEFVRAKTMTELKLFGELDSSSVILGTEEPWLFYKKADDGTTLETYKRIDHYSEDELYAIGEELRAFKAELERNGVKEFILYIAPDKESIYGDKYMPDHIVRREGESSTEQLRNFLEREYPDIHVIYPAEEFRASEGSLKGAETLYYKTDTHWNLAGAFLGMSILMDETARLFGTEYTYLDTGFFDAGRAEGDLQRLALLPHAFDRVEYGYDRELQFEYTSVLESEATGENVIYEGESRSDSCMELSMYFCGDSFRLAAAGYIMEAMERACVADRHYLSLEDVSEKQPDVFVLEIAERYLHELPDIEGYNCEARPWSK